MSLKVWVGIVDGSELFSRALVTLVSGEAISERVTAFPGLGLASEAIEHGGSGGLLILDLGAPDCEGARTVHGLRQRFPDLRILVSVPTASRHSVFDYLLQGAHGCFFRTQSYTEIVTAVRAVASGEIYVPPSVSAAEGRNFLAVVAEQPAAPKATATGGRLPQPSEADPVLVLTSRQCAVLDLILKGLSNKAIARELALAEGTVKVHVNSIFRAMNVHSRLQAVTQVMETSRLPRASRYSA